MKRTFFYLMISAVLIAALSSCTFSLAGKALLTPTLVLPTITQTSATPTANPPINTPLPPTATSALPSPSATSAFPTNTRVPVTSPTVIEASPKPGSPSGPYAVILVAEGDVLNIRLGPGPAYAVAGIFTSTQTGIMRTGPSMKVGDNLWVEVQNPAGGNGWVNSAYLTETVATAAFCADTGINALLTAFSNAIRTSDGAALGPLASPAVHKDLDGNSRTGVDVRLYRYANSVVFDQDHFRYVFESTYKHNWGSGPSGMDDIGSFHQIILPLLVDVLTGSPVLTCNAAVHTSGLFQPWPYEYTNINFYEYFRPGTPGVDLDYNTFIIGVEYVQDQPYLFALIHYEWEP
jgi:hypothetical protein